MAESSQLSDISCKHVCPICQEIFVLPRSIPSCKHVFCEQCLFSFVFNLKEKRELGSTFECPVCRIPCKMNESGEVTMEWIQTFPLCAELTSDDLDCSDSQPENHTCGSCLEERNIESKKYCLDCHGYLCDECVTAHLKCKGLKKHKLMDKGHTSLALFEEIQKLTKCKTHPTNDSDLFCNCHNELMCLTCVTTSHNRCKDIIGVFDCSALNEEEAILQLKIEGTEKHIDLLQQISKNNCDAVKAKIRFYRNELQNMRDEIFKRLNEVVDNEQALTKQIIIDVEDKTFMNTQLLEHLKALCRKDLRALQTIIREGRPRERFICVKSLAFETYELEKQMNQSEFEIQVANVNLKMTDIMKKVSENLVEDQLPTSSVEYHRPDDLPTLQTSTGPFIIDKVDIHTLRLNDGCSPTYSNITVRRDGILALCDNCGSNCGFAVLYEPQEKLKQTFKLSKPYCATPTADDSILITVSMKKSISILYSGLDLKQTKQLTTKHTPRGIVALNDDKVAISWDDPPAFSISDLSGPEIQHTVFFTEDSTGRKFKSFEYMAINEKRQYVIQSCSQDKAVYCFTFKQKPVFKYTNNLLEPRGVSLDPTSGSVFVCDLGDNCIHQVSFSGNPISVIRHETLKKPLAVCYDIQRKCLWVSRGTRPYEQLSCYTQVKTVSL